MSVPYFPNKDILRSENRGELMSWISGYSSVKSIKSKEEIANIWEEARRKRDKELEQYDLFFYYGDDSKINNDPAWVGG